MTDLLPCPFCGDTQPQLYPSDYVHDDLSPWPAVECHGCNAWVPANVWNSRAPVAVPAAAKPSTCCPGEHLVPMHSTDTKLCTGCKTEKHWPLEPGQKRTY